MSVPDTSPEGSGTSLRIFAYSTQLLVLPLILLLIGCRSNGRLAPTDNPVVMHSGGVANGQPIELHSEPVAAPTSVTLNLSDCLRYAHQKQPKINAQRATLATAEEGKVAMEKLRFPVTLSGQIPFRRQQADLAVGAAAAGLDQVERETTYAVTRTYVTVAFAREQEKVAKSTVDRLNAVKEAAEKGLEAGARDVTASDVARSLVYVRLAETKHIQATQGVKRALVALREAIGFGPEVSVDTPLEGMPELEAKPTRDAVVATATTRRGELIQAKVIAQIACVEVEAQGTSMMQRMQTYAAGIDIHATQIPQGSNGADYRPTGVPPEMPTLLMGSKSERVKQAEFLFAKAESVVTTTRNLIVLEAEDAYLRWEEASQQARKAREAAEAGDKLADDLRKDLAAGLKVKIEEVVTARVMAATARADFNEYRYRELVALADLERATSGGFCAGFVRKP